ncbi:helix-turn-helix domain-containing protein [Neorhizobium sp. P12A]|uniref:helix-turn-helix domain-containing protein n=1 Tax=Neorhizobium sp. P12A TaxID=2268027 RepID=UPI0011EC44F3|nr:helix-turn-helix domain-containing protein [Neorhizobium sp. P12A]KAA0690964.1 helix-turn-helix domain-containing protein [Neorhizobium sp. P12A]
MNSVPTYDLYGEISGAKTELWLHCETIPSRSRLHHWEIRLHRHERFFQILYISAGAGDVVFGDNRQAIRPHSVVTVPPGLNHGFRFSKDIDGLVVTTLLSSLKTIPGDASRFGEWLAEPHVTWLDPSNEDAAYIAMTLRRLGRTFDERRQGRNDLLDAYLTSALQLTFRLSSQEGESQGSARENERRIELLNDLIQRHFRSRKPASFYAEALGISPTHLNRIVRPMTGQGTHELITRKLIDEAKRELVFTFASVQEIGDRFGFADPAYFSRFFLKETGETPRAWRIAQRKTLGL